MIWTESRDEKKVIRWRTVSGKEGETPWNPNIVVEEVKTVKPKFKFTWEDAGDEG